LEEPLVDVPRELLGSGPEDGREKIARVAAARCHSVRK
jgi:hypothetical protein